MPETKATAFEDFPAMGVLDPAWPAWAEKHTAAEVGAILADWSYTAFDAAPAHSKLREWVEQNYHKG